MMRDGKCSKWLSGVILLIYVGGAHLGNWANPAKPLRALTTTYNPLITTYNRLQPIYNLLIYVQLSVPKCRIS